MTNTMFRIALAMVMIAAMILTAACPGTNPANQNSGPVNANKVLADANTAAAVDSDCSGTIQEKRAKVYNGVGNNFTQKLKDQKKAGLFTYDVTVNDSHLDIKVIGVVSGEGTLDDLAKALKPYVKRGCVEKVSFVPNGSTLAAAGGFTWLVCEDPKIPCPHGECATACPTIVPTPTVKKD